MTTWIGLRLLKFTALAALAWGLAIGVGHPKQAERMRATAWVATPALWFTWLAGYLLLKTTSRPLSAPFVAVGLLASLTALHGAVLSAWKPSPRSVSRGLALAGLCVATAAMVARDAGGVTLAGSSTVAALVGFGLARTLPAVDPSPDDLRQATRRWFHTVAALEGTSLVLMMLVAMPLRRVTGVSLDGGTGALGWAHGALVLLYLQALQVTARTLGWSARTTATAFFASLVPFGTFWFSWTERPPALVASEAGHRAG